MSNTIAAPGDGAKKNENPVAPNGTANNGTSNDSVIAPRDVQEVECLPLVDNELQQRTPIIVDGKNLWTIPHEELEAIVDLYLSGAIKTSMALYALHERREYGDRTFEQFCKERFRLSRQRGYQLLGAADMVSTMVDMGLPPPANERIARALIPVKNDPDALRAVSKELEEQPNATAAAAQAAVQRIQQKAAPPTNEQAPGEQTTAEKQKAKRLAEKEKREWQKKLAEFVQDIIPAEPIDCCFCDDDGNEIEFPPIGELVDSYMAETCAKWSEKERLRHFEDDVESLEQLSKFLPKFIEELKAKLAKDAPVA